MKFLLAESKLGHNDPIPPPSGDLDVFWHLIAPFRLSKCVFICVNRFLSFSHQS